MPDRRRRLWLIFSVNGCVVSTEAIWSNILLEWSPSIHWSQKIATSPGVWWWSWPLHGSGGGRVGVDQSLISRAQNKCSVKLVSSVCFGESKYIYVSYDFGVSLSRTFLLRHVCVSLKFSFIFCLSRNECVVKKLKKN